jgi:methylase of polypeptide subunit release factors
MTTYKTIRYGSIDVCYLDEIDGGGARFGQDYLALLPDHIGKAERALEWCAGPGFIGFSLLAAGLCTRLTLIDVNPVATAACRETIRINELADRVQVYDSDCMESVAPDDRFDLVVANPPHCSDTTPSPGGHTQLIYNDIGWQTHRRFYQQISPHLSEDSRIILQEDAGLSSAEDFRAMIEDAGLQLLGALPCVWAHEYYYVESQLATVTSDS